MQTSPLWDEIRAEGRAEGLEKGRLEGVRATVLRQGRRKFGKAPTKKQRAEMDAVADLARLEALAERVLEVSSWADLLNGG